MRKFARIRRHVDVTEMKNGIALRMVLAGLLLFIFCSNGPAGEKKLREIALKEVLSIGALDDDLLYMWAGITTDEEGNIYISDAMDYSIKKFGSSGQLLNKVGRRGQGPGEFLAPRLLASWNGMLYATDQTLSGVQVFDENLIYKYKIPFKWPISDIKALPDIRIAVISFSMGRGSELFILDHSGAILGGLDYGNKQETLLLNNADLEIDQEGNLYLAYSFQDRIEKWTSSGEKIWAQNLLGIKKIEQKKVDKFMVPTKVTYKNILLDNLDNREYLFILSGHLAENPSRDIFVLNNDGEHLTTFTLPEASHCIHLDRRGFLYSRANEGVTLKKYKLHYVYE